MKPFYLTVIAVILVFFRICIAEQKPAKKVQVNITDTVFDNNYETSSGCDILMLNLLDSAYSDYDSNTINTSAFADSKSFDNEIIDSVSEQEKIFYLDSCNDEDTVFLIPGISYLQDSFGIELVSSFYSFQWEKADELARKMQRLERKKNLPPLSYLLMVSGRVVRLQNGEYKDRWEKRNLLKEVSNLASEGLKISNPSKNPDSLLPAMLFINSGIKGFMATLKIKKNLIEAAIEGFSALRGLEKLVKIQPEIKDTYLGLGIFYCALARAPLIVRGALSLRGRDISFKNGINFLRKSAYNGRYTSETAKQYLIQFLSPYWGHLAKEKQEIFKSLQSDYPRNLFFRFLENEENICFHRELITGEYIEKLRQTLLSYKAEGYSEKRYYNLVKYQYQFFDSDTKDLQPSKFDLKEYSFYPLFLEVLRIKSLNSNNTEFDDELRKKREQVAKVLQSSDMSYNLKNYFAWHIRDALEQ